MDKNEILANLKKDKRTPQQIFGALRQKIIEHSGGKINDEDATQAARNLINVFEIALEIPTEKRSFILDKKSEEC